MGASISFCQLGMEKPENTRVNRQTVVAAGELAQFDRD